MSDLALDEVLGYFSGPTKALFEFTLSHRAEPEFNVAYIKPGISIEPTLHEELVKWRRAFIGKPLICYTHAASVIMIRRWLHSEICLPFFLQIWREFSKELCENLDTKWLISACDTFLDYGESELDRSYALSAALLMKTVKLYESELISRDAFSKEIVEIEKQELFNQYYTFSIFKGDLIDSLRKRVEALDECSGSPTKIILKKIFKNINEFDTVYTRLNRRAALD